MPAAHGTTAATAPTESRGTTSIPAQVVARIAEQVASEVPHIGSDAGGVLGVGARRDFASRPSAECDLYGSTAVLRLDVGVDFPAPLAPALTALREHVHERVEHLTGLEVGRLDVKISWLNPATRGRRTLR
ncbi:Asp23/Gls24 family envelope stress response protein [Brachybacterium sp. AOP43-C2-M15]|uniref:Asp23/Gls24 family envelope stress response protein n=1 Tax=Brachybacterium sp. AOP43-C2-M15 TaxID=3457661 RepID=UPI0040347384